MKRLLSNELPTASRPVPLPDTEANHAIKVLRLRDGDEIIALDGRGHQVIAVLRVKGAFTRLEFARDGVPGEGSGLGAQTLPITLEMTVLKGDAMEWVVEKAVELGIQRLQPVLTHHTVVQMKNKGPEAFQERWQKIADQSLKQCGRLSRMEVARPMALGEFLSTSQPAGSLRLACDELREGMPHLIDVLLGGMPGAGGLPANASLLIGPEGGWSEVERDLLRSEESMGRLRRVSLGPLVFRAETAAVFGLSLLNASFQSANWPGIN